jgi:heme-degrading monooxygenase HmoA
MVTEHALITVDPDRAGDFETAFDQARKVIGAAAGFGGLRLLRGIESPGTYLLLVEWETLEHHTVGFRESAAFGEWRALVGPFFAAPPVVEHFELRV